MDTSTEVTGQNFQDIAAKALRKTSSKIIDSVPDDGLLTDTAVSLAGAIEKVATTLSDANLTFDEILPALKKLPWKSLATGAAVLAGGVYLSNNKKAVSGFTKEFESLLKRATLPAKSKKIATKAVPKKLAAKAKKTVAKKAKKMTARAR
jgi:hypothetical protein